MLCYEGCFVVLWQNIMLFIGAIEIFGMNLTVALCFKVIKKKSAIIKLENVPENLFQQANIQC